MRRIPKHSDKGLVVLSEEIKIETKTVILLVAALGYALNSYSVGGDINKKVDSDICKSCREMKNVFLIINACEMLSKKKTTSTAMIKWIAISTNFYVGRMNLMLKIS